MQKVMRKLYTVLGWAALGFMSAYIIVSLYAFSYVTLYFIYVGQPPSEWIQYTLISGAAGGFFVGLLKAAVLNKD